MIAIHQPNFLPYLGFFYKMLKADKFILLDNVQYTKGGFTNRNRIKTPAGEQWLTVPVLKSRLAKRICDVEIDEDQSWRKKHLKTFEMNYKKAPFYDEVMDQILRFVYKRDYRSLAPFNFALILEILSYCKKDVKIAIARNAFSYGLGVEHLIDLIKYYGESVYLSGPSGRGYLDENLFEREGIRIVYSDFKHPLYGQLWGSFVFNLSVIDALFMKGPDALEFD